MSEEWSAPAWAVLAVLGTVAALLLLLLAALVTASHVGRRSNPLRKQTTLDNRNQGGNS